MPKTGMQPIRRRALIEAAIATIGDEGSLDVTMSRIARTAGVSPALAHHYFGGKDALMLATMRHLLRALGEGVAAALRRARSPRGRVSGVLRESFAPEQFAPATVAAWLSFYLRAQSDPAARRLLKVYARRLRSNLVDALGRIVPPADARRIAEGTAAMIDGLYIRTALEGGAADGEAAIRLVENHVDAQLAVAGKGLRRAEGTR